MYKRLAPVDELRDILQRRVRDAQAAKEELEVRDKHFFFGFDSNC